MKIAFILNAAPKVKKSEFVIPTSLREAASAKAGEGGILLGL